MDRILLVEDSEEAQIVVERALEGAGFRVSIAGTCAGARALIANQGTNFSLVILDLVLPDGEGFQLLTELREAGYPVENPVIFLTGRADMESKVLAFDLGADDYLVKPVSPLEIRARVELRLRKARAKTTDVLSLGGLLVELKTMKVSATIDNQVTDLQLTVKEFRVLAFLMQNAGKYFTREQVVASVWGPGVNILGRTVDTHIYSLRKKLGTLANLIENVPNEGYRFIVPQADSNAV